jgi:hypothetical protein
MVSSELTLTMRAKSRDHHFLLKRVAQWAGVSPPLVGGHGGKVRFAHLPPILNIDFDANG